MTTGVACQAGGVATSGETAETAATKLCVSAFLNYFSRVAEKRRTGCRQRHTKISRKSIDNSEDMSGEGETDRQATSPLSSVQRFFSPFRGCDELQCYEHFLRNLSLITRAA